MTVVFYCLFMNPNKNYSPLNHMEYPLDAAENGITNHPEPSTKVNKLCFSALPQEAAPGRKTAIVIGSGFVGVCTSYELASKGLIRTHTNE